MRTTALGEARARGSGLRVPVALLLAATLLVCHGFFGASHLLTQEEAASRTATSVVHEPLHAKGHPAAMDAPSGAHHAAGPTTDEDGPHVGTAEYFAVLLALAGAALLASSFRVGRAVSAGPALSVLPRLRTLRLRPLSRGPSPPLLQVFRL